MSQLPAAACDVLQVALASAAGQSSIGISRAHRELRNSIRSAFSRSVKPMEKRVS
jgi:hypothetical protein